MEALLLVFAILFWFVWIQQIRRGISPNFLGEPLRRDEHPKLFDCAVIVTLILAVASTVSFWLALIAMREAG